MASNSNIGLAWVNFANICVFIIHFAGEKLLGNFDFMFVFSGLPWYLTYKFGLVFSMERGPFVLSLSPFLMQSLVWSGIWVFAKRKDVKVIAFSAYIIANCIVSFL